MRIGTEINDGIRFKLRMMGVPIDGPTLVFFDNQSVVNATTKPESTLKKKHNSIAWHMAREAVASGKIIVSKEPGTTNLADMVTKNQPGPLLHKMCECIFY